MVWPLSGVCVRAAWIRERESSHLPAWTDPKPTGVRFEGAEVPLNIHEHRLTYERSGSLVLTTMLAQDHVALVRAARIRVHSFSAEGTFVDVGAGLAITACSPLVLGAKDRRIRTQRSPGGLQYQHTPQRSRRAPLSMGWPV